MSITSILEWDKIIELAASECWTEPGRIQMEKLIDPEHWAPTCEAAKLAQVHTREMAVAIEAAPFWRLLQGLRTPASALEMLRKSQILEVDSLVLLRDWLIAIASAHEKRDDFAGCEYFFSALQSLVPFPKVLAKLQRVLTSDGRVAEDATDELRGLFRESRKIEREISVVLERLMKKYSEAGALQDAYTDVRDGRHVLPVKISKQTQVDGIVYEASVSRQTVFVEPREIENLNNRLRQAQNAIATEIYRLLQEMSMELAPCTDDMDASSSILAYWDAVQAKARLALKWDGSSLAVLESREIELRDSAHPLLWNSLPSEKIVRNSIVLKSDQRCLLITGPNTGGKTVLLKLLGVAAIAARTGFFLPGREPVRVPFFDRIFVDLGDSQSIEHRISSFSGHVRVLNLIERELTPMSLVLLDELNSATDPEEGSALARAFLEEFVSRESSSSHAMVIATTHDPKLKALATVDSRIENASMQFDDRTSEPTYRLLMRIPGRSRALEIARRLGVTAKIVDHALGYLEDGQKQIEHVISELEQRVQSAERLRLEAEKAQIEAQTLREEWEKKARVWLTEETSRIEKQVRTILNQAEEGVRDKIRLIQQEASPKKIVETRQDIQSVLERSRQQAQQTLRELVPRDFEYVAPSGIIEGTVRHIQVGDRVHLAQWKSPGRVLSINGERIEVVLLTPDGKRDTAYRLTVQRQDLNPVASVSSTRVESKKAKLSTEIPEAVPGQIDLRGRRFEEAMRELELYLDRAFRNGLIEVTIVHGLGTGAIREGTRSLLARLPYIREFVDGGVGRGGFGATVVRLG